MPCPLISIIVPCKEIDNYTRECIEHCSQLDYENCEVILLPDATNENINGIKIIPTGPVTPGVKRNIGVANSKGELFAFIDSDARPRRDWLSNAVMYLNDPNVAAVGGPGLTPEDDNTMQRASGYVLSSFMIGKLSSRYKIKGNFKSDDIHSCNLIVRKDVLNEVGGWNEKYWPGEDTLLSLQLKKLKLVLLEVSNVVVYHHRRQLFIPHLKQISRFSLHRGFFAKRFGGNSMKLTYFIPSLFVLYLVLGIAGSLFNQMIGLIFLILLNVYLLTTLFSSVLEVKEKSLIPIVLFGIILTHFVYGIYFLFGLFKGELKL